MSAPKLVYIAGPFSPTKAQLALFGKAVTKYMARRCVEENILRAKLLGVKVAKLGACPMIPHANTDHPDFEEVQPYQFWIEATKEQLRRCDAVLFAEDWEESSGARGENEVAIEESIPRFFSLNDLAGWLHQEALTDLGINWANVH